MGEVTAKSPVLHARPCCVSVFAATDRTVPAARLYVQTTLEAWGLVRLMDDAKLIVSELVTNVLRHGAGPIVVRCAISEDARFVMEVGDSSPELPAIGDRDLLDVNGRGLVIVEALADNWGARTVEGGKVTWAALNVEWREGSAPELPEWPDGGGTGTARR
jgi:anti-sigma regulatory factor (Ser/Thr protein kinase)